MENRFYVTTPIYYVNDEPHIGHAYTTILADVLAQLHRVFGDEVFFLTGTDEHGQKLQNAAVKNKREPLDYCDEMVMRFKKTWRKLHIKNDDFIRTTEERHIKVVSEILQRIYDRGEIYSAEYEGWYCVHEERFWTEKDLVEGNCPDCNRPVTKITEMNYFFKMSKYQNWLVDYIEKNPDFIQPAFRRNEVLGFLKKPLGDLCISRPKARLSWGIELPFDRQYVCYVWFDALINYISAIGYLSDDKKFESWWPAVHLIGKDILTTHAVYWPCMLKAMDLPQPKTIFAHGWWLVGETKMSKSLGNVVKPLQLADKYGVDAFRYFLMREMTLGQDSTYSEESFISRYNSDLANDLGNLLSRTLKMIQSYTDGKIPAPPGDNSDNELARRFEKLIPETREKVATLKLNRAVEDILELVRATNRYIEKNKPWALAKKGEKEKLGRILYNAAETLRLVSLLLSPIMPEKCKVIQDQLGLQDDTAGNLAWGGLKPGTSIKPGEGLFPRLQQPKAEAINMTEKEELPEGVIGFEEFGKVKMRTARVLEAEKVPKADKLLKLQIDLGSEKRQIVAGIAEYYTPEDMIGKNLVVVSNLKPAKIRGVDSNGMLLAATHGKKLVLVTTDHDIDPGAEIS
ncbi:MAG: methionine--tRNA ligase [Candidatus Zixiibacteriota bacterium]|nr:MAG: methionine--tRNA ligase [candidate division Zixibacteria bacterium]